MNNTIRDERIVQLRNEGQNLGEIGDHVGLTRERVRQILAGQGLRTMSAADHLEKAIEGWRASGELKHTVDVAKEYGLTLNSTNLAALRRGCPGLALPDSKPVGSKWDIHEIARIVRRIAIQQGIDPATGWIKLSQYGSWRQDGDPSTATINANYRWSEIMTLAGFDWDNAPKNGRQPGGEYKAHTDADLDFAVMEYIQSKPEVLSAESLEDFLVSRPDLASMATLRNRFRKQGVGTIAGIFSTVLARQPGE